MRIAIVGPTHPYKGGVSQHTTELAHRLAARGHDVVIESWSAQYPRRLYPGVQKLDAPEGEPYPRTSYPLAWNRPLGWSRLGRRLRGERDLVILVLVTPIQAPAYLGVLRGLRAGKPGSPPVVALCHNVLPHEPRPGDVPLTRAQLRRATAVLVHAPEEAAKARGLADTPVTVAPLPPHLFVSAGPRPADREPTCRLLFFGMVRPYKGLDVLLRALAEGPADVSLTVAGEFWGDQEAAARATVTELGLADRVELRTGYVDAAAVPALFAAADALVLPYRDGTATQNVRVAHLYGVPVVATRVGTLPDQVRDGVNGLLAPPADPAALAAVLRRLYEPGVLAGLAAKVEPPDADAAWSAYVDALLGSVGERPGTAD